MAVSSLGRESGEMAKRAGHLTAAYAMDDLFEATGVSYRALRMPFFKENLLGQVRAIKSQGTFSLANAADRPLATCATSDVAAGVLRRPVSFQEASTDAYRARLSQYGVAEGTAQGMADMTVAQNDGIYDHETRTPPFASPAIGFRQWCEDVLKPAVLD